MQGIKKRGLLAQSRSQSQMGAPSNTHKNQENREEGVEDGGKQFEDVSTSLELCSCVF